MDALKLKGIALGLFSTVLWGSFYPVSRVLFGKAGEQFDEFFVSFIRFLLGFLLFSPLLFTAANREKTKTALKNDWLPLLLLAFIGIVCEGVLVFVANKYTTAARASLMANTTPIPTLLLSWLFAKEMLTGRKAAGMLLGMAGALLAVLSRGGDLFSAGSATWPGDLLAFASGLCWAVFTVFGKGISRRYGALLVTAILYGAGCLLMVPVMLIARSSLSVAFTFPVWAGIVYLSVSGLLANACWYRALKYLPPGELGSFGYLSALLAVGSSILFLREKLSWGFLLAAAAVIAGVWLMVGERKKA